MQIWEATEDRPALSATALKPTDYKTVSIIAAFVHSKLDYYITLSTTIFPSLKQTASSRFRTVLRVCG